jgi:hypothetical protein
LWFCLSLLLFQLSSNPIKTIIPLVFFNWQIPPVSNAKSLNNVDVIKYKLCLFNLISIHGILNRCIFYVSWITLPSFLMYLLLMVYLFIFLFHMTQFPPKKGHMLIISWPVIIFGYHHEWWLG